MHILTKNNILIFVIVVLAFLLRVVQLNQMPPSLNWDEVSHGYNAYSILTTAKDEWGESFPTIFRAFGDYKLPVYIYTTVPFIQVFGLNEMAVRLPSVVAGTLSVLFTYFLIKELFKKNNFLAVIASLLVAISPWTLFLSRIAVEANLALTFIILGSYFLLKSIRLKNWNIILAGLFFGLSVWTYNSARIFVPLLLIAVTLIYRRELVSLLKKQKTAVMISLLIVGIFFIPMLLQLANPTGSARYENVKIIDQGSIAGIEQNRNNSTLPSVLPRVIHNKVTYFARSFGLNYISHFSPDFLFINGGSHYQFNVPNTSLLYSINLPLLIIGAFVCIKNIRKKEYQILLIWILLAPTASSVTREAPHALRAIIMLPTVLMIIALGFERCYLWLKKNKFFVTLYLMLLAISLGLYLKSYINYASEYSWSWQYGYKDAVNYAQTNYGNYDKIIFTKKYGEPHEFVLFYTDYDPTKYMNDSNLNRFYQSNWYWVDGFDKYYFVNDWLVSKNQDSFELESKKTVNCEGQKCLLITSPSNAPANWKLLDTVNFLNGEKAFEIYEN